MVDVTNPEACKWYEAKLDALVDLGVDTFKVSCRADPPLPLFSCRLTWEICGAFED